MSEGGAKRRPGRQPMGNDARTVTVAMKVSAKELALWKKLAKQKGVSFAEFALGPLRRSLKRKEAVKVKLSEVASPGKKGKG